MALTDNEIKAIRSDALTPAETEAKAEALGIAKASMPFWKCFVSAMLAGAFIAFGALYFCVFLGDTSIPFGAQRLVGGFCFCLGLVLVLCCGAELFTGNILMLCSRMSKRIDWKGTLRNWGIVWLGNLAGALVAVAIVWLAQIWTMNGGQVAETMVSIAAGKVGLDPVVMFFRGILCNVFVCLAVWIGFSARTVADKVIGILLPISAFVACSFEHCVANMFFLPMGLVLNAGGIGAAGAVTLGGVAFNIVVVTLANIVGGALVAFAYWFIYAKRSR